MHGINRKLLEDGHCIAAGEPQRIAAPWHLWAGHAFERPARLTLVAEQEDAMLEIL